MKHVYVAGKYRGASGWDVERNVRAAEEAGLEIARMGGIPVIPHTMYRFFDGVLTDEFWIDATMSLLLRCDAIAMLPDWEESDGASGEHDAAHDEKIPIFYLEHQERELREWLNQRR